MGTVSVEDARQMVARNEVEVVDLRDEDGWMDGHIPGAHRAGDDLDETVEGIDDDRKLLIVCADGERSAQVAEELSEGDREADSLEGGMKSWKKEGLRTQPAQDYVPGPEPVEGEDADQVAELEEGTIDEDSGREEEGEGEAQSDGEPDAEDESDGEPDSEDESDSEPDSGTEPESESEPAPAGEERGSA